MQIFDFSTGTKGAYICSVEHVEGVGSWHIKDSAGVLKKVLRGRYAYCDELYNTGSWPSNLGAYRYTPAQLKAKFGTEAICFCMGSPTSGWEWRFMATREWLNANRSILTVTKVQ